MTWDHCGDHARPKERIAAILSPRLSAGLVRDLVEFIYLNASYSVAERISIMKNPRTNPYRAEFDWIGGVPWSGRIHCGHNPWLFARLVDNLRTSPGNDGDEEVHWAERPIPQQLARLSTGARRSAKE